MCLNCFSSEVYEFKSFQHFLNLEKRIFKNVSEGKMEFVRKMLKNDYPILSFGWIEIPFYINVGYCCDIYKCKSCLTYYEISIPENSFRGSLKKINSLEVMLSTDYKIQQGKQIFVFPILKELEIAPFLRERFLNTKDSPYEIMSFRLRVGWFGKKNDFVLLHYKYCNSKLLFFNEFEQAVKEFYEKQYVSEINFIHLSDDLPNEFELIRYIKNKLL